MITVKNIKKSYNGELVLKNINLKIEDGEFVSIMGESGSGKSTLLSIIGAYLMPDSGEVLWDGEDVLRFSDAKISAMRSSSVGFVFQSFKLIPTLNVKDNLLLPATLGKKVNEETLKYLDDLTRELKIDSLAHKFPEQLSGGQCQRVAIARALVYKPSVIILDEPTGALDSVMEERVMKILKRVNETMGATIIQVTHSERVAAYASRIIRLSDGEICV